MASTPTRLASCPSRWLSLVCKIPIPLFSLSETNTIGYLAEKILTSRSALEGEHKQVTVLFADLKGSMELLADRDPEDARQLLDPCWSG